MFRLGSRTFTSTSSANKYVAAELAAYFPSTASEKIWPGTPVMVPDKDALEWVLPLLRRTEKGFRMSTRVLCGQGAIYVQYDCGQRLDDCWERGEPRLFFVSTSATDNQHLCSIMEGCDFKEAAETVAACLYPRYYWWAGAGGPTPTDFSRSFTPQSFREMAREFLLCMTRKGILNKLPVSKILYPAAQAAAAAERMPFRFVYDIPFPPQRPVAVASTRTTVDALRAAVAETMRGAAPGPPPAQLPPPLPMKKKQKKPLSEEHKVKAAQKRSEVRAKKKEKERRQVQENNRLITDFARP